jgi:sigma-B regulation protein RsbU (phosphoserine phosphatase)
LSGQQKGHAENLIDILSTQVGVKQQEIDALLDMTRAINENVSEKQMLQIFDFTLMVHLKVKRIAVFLHDENWNMAFQRQAKAITNELEVERDLLQFKEVKKYEENEARPEAIKDFDLIIPVRHKNNPIAFLLMGYPHTESYEVMEEKVRFIEAFANIVVVAIENKKLFKRQLEQEGMKRELKVAAQVQNLLIPNVLPDNEFVQMAAVYLPHRNVGGDYYDYIQLSKDEFVFVIADISGKGTGAALLMANFQANVRALIKTASINLKGFVRQLNENILGITQGEKFITMFLGRYNVQSRKLNYISCGHNPTVLYQDGETHLLSEGCTIIGMFEELPSVKVGSVDISKNAVIVNYTDGVTDLENEHGLNYSTDHLVHYLQRNPDTQMKPFIKGIMTEIYQFKGEMEYVDDITMLALRLH